MSKTRIAVIVGAATLALAGGIACGGGGQQPCGRKDLKRVVHQDGHTVTQRCVDGPNGLHWEKVSG